MAGLTFNIFGNDVSASKALKKVEGQASRSAKTIGGSFKKLGGLVAGGLAGFGAASFLKGSFDEATEAQKVGAQTAAVLKSTGNAAHTSAKQIGDLSTAISNKVGIDDEAIQSGANMLLTFTNLRNEAGKGNDVFNQATQTLTDMSVATGKDMKSSAIQLGKALNDPIKGITSLTRVGVTFTKGQKDQIKHLVDSGHTMQAQKLILRELNKEFGGSAAAQATPAEKAQVAWKNLQEQIGNYLLPVVAKFANFIVRTVVPAVQQVIGWVQKHKEGFIQLGNTLKAIAIGVYEHIVKPIIAALVPVIKSIIGWVKEHKKGLEQLAKVLAGAIVIAVKIVIAIFKALVKTIKAVVKAVMWFWHNVIEPASAGISKAFRAMSTGLRWVWHNVIHPIFNAIKSGIHAVHGAVFGAVHAISNVFKGIGNGLKWAWNHIIHPILNAIQTALSTIIDSFEYVTSLGQSQGHLDGSVTQNPDGSITFGKTGTSKTSSVTNNVTINQNNVIPKSSSTATPDAIRTASNSLVKAI